MNRYEEKLEWEYEIFYLDLAHTSKANIFAKSNEIEKKKQIYLVLKEFGHGLEKRNTDLLEKLLGLDNTLEEAYRFLMDHTADFTSQELVREKTVSWLRTL